MSFEAKIKITAESGASINYAGPLDEAQKDAIVGILNGETDIATLEQEARQMRARMERLESENAALVAEVQTEKCLSFRNQVEALEAHRDELLALLRNDAYAISFQTLGQYRSAIIASAKGGAAC